jgi:hypothetical protein
MPEQLQSFKIGDKVGRNPQKPAGKAPAADEKPSTGFPRVEALIDEYQTAAEAKDVFADSIARIDGLAAVEKNTKKKADLVKVKRAFEHTMATLDYLFQVRAELSTQPVNPPASNKSR